MTRPLTAAEYARALYALARDVAATMQSGEVYEILESCHGIVVPEDER